VPRRRGKGVCRQTDFLDEGLALAEIAGDFCRECVDFAFFLRAVGEGREEVFCVELVEGGDLGPYGSEVGRGRGWGRHYFLHGYQLV